MTFTGAVEAFFEHAGRPVSVGVLCAALVVGAALVRRFRPTHKRQLRRTLLLGAAWLVGAMLAVAVEAVGGGGPHRWLAVVTDLLHAWAVVAITSLVLFDLLLPALGVVLIDITSDLLTGAAYFFVTAAVAAAAGLDLTSVLAASTVAAAILTISLQSTLGNVVGGLALQIEGTIHVGDWIQLENGRQGQVTSIRWRHTELETRDWDLIVVPNAVLLQGLFTILGRRGGQNTRHRLSVPFNVDHRFSPTEVATVVEESLRAAPIPNVAVDPPPSVVCIDISRDSWATYQARIWIHDVGPDDPTASAVRGRIHAALRRVGIPLARPSHTYFNIPDDADDHLSRREHRAERAVAVLDQVPLFATLTEEERELLAAKLIFAPFDAGEFITRQGAVAHFLYLLETGVAEIRTVTDSGQDRLVKTLAAPAFFGEMGLMTGEPRLANVLAVTPVICYRLDKSAFQGILQRRPELAAEVSAILAARRVELLSIRGATGAENTADQERTERERILNRIRSFFGLDS